MLKEVCDFCQQRPPAFTSKAGEYVVCNECEAVRQKIETVVFNKIWGTLTETQKLLHHTGDVLFAVFKTKDFARQKLGSYGEEFVATLEKLRQEAIDLVRN